MIRCPTCGMEWSAGTLTCPKDGTRLFEAVAAATIGVDDDGGDHTVRAQGGLAEVGMLDTLPTTASEQPAAVRAVAAAAVDRPQRASGNRRSLDPSAEPRVSSKHVAQLPPEPRGANKPKYLHAVPPRPTAMAPVQPMPSPQGEKNPWGEEGSGSGTDPTAPSRGLVGVQLGEYHVLEQLGQGGMGIVYRGEQPVIGKQVAIKVLRPELASDPKQMKRLLDEARAVNAVRHPGLVDIFSFGQTPDGAQYFVMELLEGQSLEERLHARGKLKAWEAVPILEQALSALDAAHGAGVIHRDLKPSNIFLVDLPDHTHLVKLLDFGLAKIGAGPRGSTPQTTNVVVGTPEYMAPEQARAQEVSPRTDIYAMGIVAYELLTGDVPFSTESAVETLMMQLDKPPTPPGEREPTIPDALEDLILRMMAKRPDERPQSAAEVKRELGRIKRQLTQADTVIGEKPLASRSGLETLPVGAGAGPTPVQNARPDEATQTTPSMRAVPVPQGNGRFQATDIVPPVVVDDTPLPRRPLDGRPSAERVTRPSGSRTWLLPAVAGAALVALLGVWFFVFFVREGADVELTPPPPPKGVPVPRGLPEPPKPAEPDEAVQAPEPPRAAPDSARSATPKLEAPRPPRPSAPPKKTQAHTLAEVVDRAGKLKVVASNSSKLAGPQAQRALAAIVDSAQSGSIPPDEAWSNLDQVEKQLK